MRQRWRGVIGAGLVLASFSGWSQEQAAGSSVSSPQPQPPVSAQAQDPSTGDGQDPAKEDWSKVQTLGEVRAVGPDLKSWSPTDLYGFRNRYEVPPNEFDKSYKPPPSVKQISEGGGYLIYGITKGVVAAAKAINRWTGGPQQIQPAIARPPPLNEQQMQRAAELCQDCETGQ